MKKIIITFMLLFVFGVVVVSRMSEISAYDDSFSELYEQKEVTLVSETSFYVDAYEASTYYYGVLNNWLSSGAQMPDDVLTINASEINGCDVLLEDNSEGYGTSVKACEPLDVMTFNVSTFEEGLYEIYLDYYVLSETKLRPSISVEINDTIQYNELNNVELPIKWELDSEITYDRFGDELTANSTLLSEWTTTGLHENNAFYIDPIKVYLQEGNNTINITLNEGYVLFGDIEFSNQSEDTLNYAEYFNNNTQDVITTSTIEPIQAERYIYESRQNIRSKYVRDASLTPYTYENRVQNVLDETSFRQAGDSVFYLFDVEETGYYAISLKYLQSENPGLSSKRSILIDGEIPFEEFSAYDFDYTQTYQIETLGTDDTPYYVYLDEGTHSLELKVTNSDVVDVYHTLVDVLDTINTLARDINKITGGLTDDTRDYKLDVYIPNLLTDLQSVDDRLTNVSLELIEIYGADDLAILSEIEVAQKYLKEFIEDVNEIPSRQERFNEGESSAYGRINAILPLLVDNPLELDMIMIHGSEDELPSASRGIFVNLIEGVKAFFYSFFDPKYNEVDVVDENTVEVWVRSSRLYIQVMQRMIDEQYANSDTKILLSVMPDENKIVLANAAGTTPDAAMGLTVTKPFEFAIRGMVTDLSQFDGFYDIAEEYNRNSFIPFIYEDGIYAMPETMDVKLLFYRKDTLDFLGVEPPETWEEVISLIPIMQKYNYDFYTPIGGDNAFKTFGETLPFIFQHGGIVYDDTGLEVLINEEGAYDAFEFMTDLFSIYNVPITTSNFYQKFRTGEVPLGIGDGNMYMQLKYAAPELAGQWGVLPIPGIEYEADSEMCEDNLTEDGRCIARWDPTYGNSSVIFNDSTKQEAAWEFFTWWFSSDAQSEFTYQLQSLLGDEFLYMTANIVGFENSAWPSDSKYQVLEQWEWIRTIGKIPGDYLVERELSNAWNAVVNDGTSARVAIDDAVIIINRELKRKLEEFGYVVDGEMVKPYIVPTYDNIDDWFDVGGAS
jgi:ABC-type glycerol-3-phosphate transport system substrate-binding protein